MFLDFALLTEQQGELLDQIEFQVKQAGDYVEEANVDVHQAIEYQKSIRKKQWCVLSAVILFTLPLRYRIHTHQLPFLSTIFYPRAAVSWIILIAVVAIIVILFALKILP